MSLTDRPLSYTQMSDFLTCRHRWFTKYVLGVRPITRSLPMELGDGVHQAIAAKLAGGDPDAALDQWREKLLSQIPIVNADAEDAVDDLYRTAQAVVDRALDGLRELGYWTLYDANDVPYVERDMMIQPPHTVWPSGVVIKTDWIAHDYRNNRNWIVDFKTRGYFTSEADEFANLQNAMYHAGALVNGIDVAGTITFQISSTPVKQPKLTKSGDMSRAAVACDWSTYEAALVRAGLDPAGYADMREKLLDKQFIKVVPVVRSAETIKRIWDKVVEPVAEEMRHIVDLYEADYSDVVAGKTPRFLSPRVCNMCNVRSLCHGKLSGQDMSDDLRVNYRAQPHAYAYFEGSDE